MADSKDTVTDGHQADTSSVDALLASEDPQFAASMAEIRKIAKIDPADTGSGVEIDSLDLNAIAPEALLSFPKRVLAKFSEGIDDGVSFFKNFPAHARTFAKHGLKTGLVKTKDGLLFVVKKIRDLLTSFGYLPRSSQYLVFATILLAALATFVIKKTVAGHVLPKLQSVYLRSYAEVADAKFKYEADEPMENFTDPLYHPEHVVLMDKVIVNLKRLNPDSTPMGLFEFYVELSTHEGAVEIKSREVEARDLISRTLEQMSYEELVTPEGKNKLKVILRKNLNELLTEGRVRRVFFKTVVVKP
jgi:flagellar basal body-associated protein FliL